MARSDRNLIRRNDLLGFEGPCGLSASASDHNEIVDNIASALPGFGIAVGGSHNWIAHNTAFGDSRPDQGPGGGILVGAGARNLVSGNTASGDPDGISVAEATSRTLVAFNTANGSVDDGIDVDSATTTLRANTANNNGDLGIEAVPGVRDAGGNRASGNGNPLQCLNVFCM